MIDNLPAHKAPGIREAIEARGATLRYSCSARRAAARPAAGITYGASKLPFAIRHRPTLYVTKFASCVGSPFVIPDRVVIRALVTFAIVPVFRDRAQD